MQTGNHHNCGFRASVDFVRLLPFCLALIFVPATQAQNIQNPQSAVDNLTRSNLKVDEATGAMQLQIPLGEYRGRGQASLPILLNYSSKVWNIKYISTASCSNEPVSAFRGDYAHGSASGWTSTLGWFLPQEDTSLETYDSYTLKPAQKPYRSPQDCCSTLFRIMRKYVTLPDGSRHEVRYDDARHDPSTGFSLGSYYAVDGSRLVYDSSSGTLLMPDGTRWNGSQYIDRNGNALTYNASTSSWTDTLGRSLAVPIPGSPPASGDYSYTMPGVNGTPITYTLRWRNLGDALTDPTQPLHYIGDMTSANCGTGNPQPNNLFSTIDSQSKVLQGGIFNPVVLSQIVLPNGSSYTFTYNVYGELNKIVYPTGGSEQFGYGALTPLGGQLDDGTYSQANRGVYSRIVSDGTTTQLWRYNDTRFGAGVDSATASRSITAPDGTVTVTWYYIGRGANIQYGFDDARTGMAREERVYNSAGMMLRRTLYQLAEDGAQSGGYATATRNARVTKKVDIILDTGGNALAAATEMVYDGDLNVISTKHYDYASIDQTTAQTADVPSIPNGTLLRTEETTFLINDPNIDASVRAAYRARNLLSLPTSTRIRDGVGNIIAQSSIAYDETLLQGIGASNGWIDPQTTCRGNPTSTSCWLNTTNTYLTTHANYDQFGNVRATTDAKGNQSELDYAATYSYAYPTTATSAVPDPTGQHGSAVALVTSTVFDFNTGLVTSIADANNVSTTFAYADPLNRLTGTVHASGTSAQTQTTVSYDDLNRVITTTSDLNSFGDNLLKSQVVYDSLGRKIESRQYESASKYIAVQLQYDALGRAYKVSNGFRPLAPDNETAIWTTSAFDALGRVISVTTPDGAVMGTSYSGNTVTITDQAGKQRQSVTDALGRLIQVYEDPAGLNYLTNYSYDSVDNLITVKQGTQTRTFVYDSLKRLTTATNPENGTITYVYDNNSNLLTKTDARNIASTYVYDALNRVTSRSYSDSTPGVTYSYDAASVVNSRGRLTSVSSSVSNYNYGAYDPLGRATTGAQVTGGQTYSTSYQYNLAGGVVSKTYPSGRVVKTDYDSAGRIAGVKNSNGVYYAGAASSDAANSLQYSAAGALQTMKLGNGLWEHTNYNSRLQPTQIALSSMSTNSTLIQLDYAYGTTNNNGNVQSQTITVPTVGSVDGLTATQTYTYDSLNRLANAQENNGTSWNQNFGYDRYGNRGLLSGTTLPAGLGPANNPAINPNNNRIDNTISGQSSVLYDSAGNLTRDVGGHTFQYDAENKMLSYDGGATAGGGASYSYDGDGRRIKKVVGGSVITTTVFVYDINGQLIAEYADSGATGSGTSYMTSDTLGSPRVITGSNQQVIGRHDYLPFGEELFAGTGGRSPQQNFGADNLRQKFTGYERDGETGLDYASARYYSSAQGRFSSPDPLMASAVTKNPQSWNRYTYVMNRPLTHIDPDGTDPCTPKNTCFMTTAADAEALTRQNPQSALIQESVSIPISRSELTTTNSGFDPESVSLNLTDVTKPVLMDQYVPTPHIGPESEPQSGDRFNFTQINVGVPSGVGPVSFDFSVTRDDFGNWYLGGGFGVGFAYPVGASVLAGTTYDGSGQAVYDEDSVSNILSGPSTSFTAGAGIVLSTSWNTVQNGSGLPIPVIPNPRGGSTMAAGFGPPQIGLSHQTASKLPGKF